MGCCVMVFYYIDFFELFVKNKELSCCMDMGCSFGCFLLQVLYNYYQELKSKCYGCILLLVCSL